MTHFMWVLSTEPRPLHEQNALLTAERFLQSQPLDIMLASLKLDPHTNYV